MTLLFLTAENEVSNWGRLPCNEVGICIFASTLVRIFGTYVDVLKDISQDCKELHILIRTSVTYCHICALTGSRCDKTDVEVTKPYRCKVDDLMARYPNVCEKCLACRAVSSVSLRRSNRVIGVLPPKPEQRVAVSQSLSLKKDRRSLDTS